jgi:hypothetical protein
MDRRSASSRLSRPASHSATANYPSAPAHPGLRPPSHYHASDCTHLDERCTTCSGRQTTFFGAVRTHLCGNPVCPSFARLTGISADSRTPGPPPRSGFRTVYVLRRRGRRITSTLATMNPNRHRDNAISAFSRSQRQTDLQKKLIDLTEAQFHATMATFESSELVLEQLRKRN